MTFVLRILLSVHTTTLPLTSIHYPGFQYTISSPLHTTLYFNTLFYAGFCDSVARTHMQGDDCTHVRTRANAQVQRTQNRSQVPEPELDYEIVGDVDELRDLFGDSSEQDAQSKHFSDTESDEAEGKPARADGTVGKGVGDRFQKSSNQETGKRDSRGEGEREALNTYKAADSEAKVGWFDSEGADAAGSDDTWPCSECGEIDCEEKSAFWAAAGVEVCVCVYVCSVCVQCVRACVCMCVSVCSVCVQCLCTLCGCSVCDYTHCHIVWVGERAHVCTCARALPCPSTHILHTHKNTYEYTHSNTLTHTHTHMCCLACAKKTGERVGRCV